MPIDSKTSQCFIHSRLQISESYSNCPTYDDNFKKSEFKKLYPEFSIIAITFIDI